MKNRKKRKKRKRKKRKKITGRRRKGEKVRRTTLFPSSSERSVT